MTRTTILSHRPPRSTKALGDDGHGINHSAGGKDRHPAELPVLAYADRVPGGPELVGGLQENFASSCNYIQNPEIIDWLRHIPNGPPAPAPIMLVRCRGAVSLDHGEFEPILAAIV